MRGGKSGSVAQEFQLGFFGEPDAAQVAGLFFVSLRVGGAKGGKGGGGFSLQDEDADLAFAGRGGGELGGLGFGGLFFAFQPGDASGEFGAFAFGAETFGFCGSPGGGFLLEAGGLGFVLTLLFVETGAALVRGAFGG